MAYVVQTLEQTFSQVHVSDWVDSFRELYRSRQLAVAVTPMVFDAFEVPLVNKHHNLFALAVVDLFKQLFVFLINENAFELREKGGSCLSEPVDHVLVHALLGESCMPYKVLLLNHVVALADPLCLLPEESSCNIIEKVESRFVL